MGLWASLPTREDANLPTCQPAKPWGRRAGGPEGRRAMGALCQPAKTPTREAMGPEGRRAMGALCQPAKTPTCEAMGPEGRRAGGALHSRRRDFRLLAKTSSCRRPTTSHRTATTTSHVRTRITRYSRDASSWSAIRPSRLYPIGDRGARQVRGGSAEPGRARRRIEVCWCQRDSAMDRSHSRSGG